MTHKRSFMAIYKTSPWTGGESIDSPDGKFTLCYHAHGEVGMGGPSTGKTWLFDKNNKCKLLDEGAASAIIWSDDSRYLAYAKWDEANSQNIVIVRVEDMAIKQTKGERVTIFESFEGGILRLFYDHELNKRMLGDRYKPKDEIVVNADEIFADRPVGKKAELKIHSPWSHYIRLVSPNGKFTLEYAKYGRFEESGKVWLSGESVARRKLEDEAKAAVIFSSDSKYLAYVKRVENVEDIVIVRLSDMQKAQENGAYGITMFESFESGILKLDYALGYERDDKISINADELFCRA